MKYNSIFTAVILILLVAAQSQATWTTLDMPGATYTTLVGIDGTNILGSYGDSNGKTHGLMYDGTDWTTIDYPGAVITQAYGIGGGNIIIAAGAGSALVTDGYLYDGTDIKIMLDTGDVNAAVTNFSAPGGTVVTTTQSLKVGKGANPDQSLLGKLDNISIYNDFLSSKKRGCNISTEIQPVLVPAGISTHSW